MPRTPAAAAWTQTRTMSDPKITIRGTAAVSGSALAEIERVYTVVARALTAAYPRNKLDGVTVYVTNGEPWAQLEKLEPVGSFWGAEGDEIRGGATPDHLWLDEQMIWKTGVRTRNEAFAAGRRASRDDIVRTFDQVVHEFAHVMDYRFGLRPQIEKLWAGTAKPEEEWAAAVQAWFGVRSGGTYKARAKGDSLVRKLFGDSPFAEKSAFTRNGEVAPVLTLPAVRFSVVGDPGPDPAATIPAPGAKDRATVRFVNLEQPGDRVQARQVFAFALSSDYPDGRALHFHVPAGMVLDVVAPVGTRWSVLSHFGEEVAAVTATRGPRGTQCVVLPNFGNRVSPDMAAETLGVTPPRPAATTADRPVVTFLNARPRTSRVAQISDATIVAYETDVSRDPRVAVRRLRLDSLGSSDVFSPRFGLWDVRDARGHSLQVWEAGALTSPVVAPDPVLPGTGSVTIGVRSEHKIILDLPDATAPPAPLPFRNAPPPPPPLPFRTAPPKPPTPGFRTRP